MPEKSPCDDCPVRFVPARERSPEVVEVRVRHELRMKAEYFDLQPTTIEADAVARCRHWHRWAEALGLSEEVVIALKNRKEARNLTEKS